MMNEVYNKNNGSISIQHLPKSICERALWAREEFIKNPNKSQTDDECLIWTYSTKDKLWYSIGGNYSQFSPEEKRIKEYLREKKYKEKEKSAEEIATEYYELILYQSKIRQTVLKRDNYTCQLCGKTGDSKLHIHHILKRNETRNDCLDNLITCCPPCHRKADSKKFYNPKWK